MAHVDVLHVALAGALGGGFGDAAADEAGVDAVAGEPMEGDAVLGVEHFGFEERTVGAGDMIVAAVGEDASTSMRTSLMRAARAVTSGEGLGGMLR